MDLISLYHSNRRIFWLVIIATINTLVALSLTWFFKDELNVWSLNASKEDLTYLYLILTPVVASGLFSTTLLAACGGYFLGWQSLIFFVPVYMVATILGYLVGRTNEKGQLEESLMKIEETSVILTNLYKRHWLVIFFLRISPVLPFAVINILLGAIRTPWLTFLSATLVGMVPRTILAILTGISIKGLGKGFSDETPIHYYIILICFVAVSLWFLSKLTQKKADQSEKS